MGLIGQPFSNYRVCLPICPYDNMLRAPSVLDRDFVFAATCRSAELKSSECVFIHFGTIMNKWSSFNELNLTNQSHFEVAELRQVFLFLCVLTTFLGQRKVPTLHTVPVSSVVKTNFKNEIFLLSSHSEEQRIMLVPVRPD